MLSGNLRTYWTGWYPTLELLHYPQHQQVQVQQQNQPAVVHFPCPPDQQLHLRGAVPITEEARAQVEDNANRISPESVFMRRCYMTAGAFTMAAVCQLMVLSEAIPPRADVLMPGFVCCLVAVVSLILLCIGGRLRKFYWFSSILAWLFAELAAVGVVLVLVERTLRGVCIALMAASGTMVICYGVGAWLPRFLLPGEMAIGIIIVGFAVASMVIMGLYIHTELLAFHMVYFGMLGVMLIPASIYHAQVIHGRRFKLPPHEFILCAVHVYLHFLMLFTAFYYSVWLPKL
ncbi:hypothetical protein KR009_007863 [Drosophila setifemur]|nr:hypothetical protein KR009_007863 [Drosophila setifemur]